MVYPTAEDWQALEIAAGVEHEVPFALRLNYLEEQLVDGTFRRVGTNVVNRVIELPDEIIEDSAKYSVLEQGVVIDDSNVYNSYLGINTHVTKDSVVDSSSVGVSTINFAFVIRSSISGSKIDDADVYDSTIGNSTVDRKANVTDGSTVLTGSTISSSEITDSVISDGSRVESSSAVENSRIKYSTLFNSRVKGSEVVSRSELSDAVIDNSTLVAVRTFGLETAEYGAKVTVPKHFLDFGRTIGTGEHVYAYRDSDGGLRIQAGCHTFSSTKEMMAYAKTAPEYKYLDLTWRTQYLQQIRAMATFINATKRGW